MDRRVSTPPTPFPPRRPVLTFFLLVLALSLPFWLAGAFVDRFLPASMPLRLPPSALTAFMPMVAALPAMLLMFLASGVGEELGWQGYAYERMEAGGALKASLTLGAFWIGWHVVPFIQTGHDARWVVWQCACLIPLRILTVWLFAASSRSLAVAVLFHAMTNVAEFMFPNFGSHYDPLVTFVILSVVTLGVVIRWGPRTLAGRA